MTDTSNKNQTRRFSPDMIAALSAVLVGVCALGVSLYQASIMREQSEMMRQEQRASVWPHVAVENSFRDDLFQLRIVNTGVGPAKIGPVRVTFDQEPLLTWTEFIRRVFPTRSFSYIHSKIGDRVTPSGDFETIFEVSDPALVDALETHIKRLTIEMCYCSIYEECWQYVHGFDGEITRNTIAECQGTEVDFHQ